MSDTGRLRVRKRAAGMAVAGGMVLGARDALEGRPEAPAVVVESSGAPPPLGRVSLFFHPQVPEATLVLVR